MSNNIDTNTNTNANTNAYTNTATALQHKEQIRTGKAREEVTPL
jgi:hypothetical protein